MAVARAVIVMQTLLFTAGPAQSLKVFAGHERAVCLDSAVNLYNGSSRFCEVGTTAPAAANSSFNERHVETSIELLNGFPGSSVGHSQNAAGRGD